MITILKNIGKFVTDPKNTRMIMLGVIVIILLLFLRQCNRTQHFKDQVELEKQETQRVSNNYEAAMDTIVQGQLDENTWRAEKLGYELTLDELEGKYAGLLGDFKVEKNKPPKVVIKTIYEIKEVLTEVPVFVEVDSFGNTSLAFSDSTYHDSLMTNYRFLSGRIPYKIVFDQVDSTYKVVPDVGAFDLTLGMNLNLGLFQDKNTRKISIMADTDYPGVTFTSIEGASIMDDPANNKILRQMRKPWGLGLNLGYGAVVDVKNGKVSTGPYFGVGLSYTPKFLQWGK
jgi:hypothetical protein